MTVRQIVGIAIILLALSISASAAMVGDVRAGYAIQGGALFTNTEVSLQCIGSEVFQNSYSASTFITGPTVYESSVNVTGLENSSEREIMTDTALSGGGVAVVSENMAVSGSYPVPSECCGVVHGTPYCYSATSGYSVFGANTVQAQTGMYSGNVMDTVLNTGLNVAGQGGYLSIGNGYASVTPETQDTFKQNILIRKNYAVSGGFSYTRNPAPAQMAPDSGYIPGQMCPF